MKLAKVSSILCAAVLIAAACGSSKKSGVATAAAPTATTPTTSTPSPLMPPPLPNPTVSGIREPGTEELTAIQTKYKDVTLEKLKEGHTLYTGQTCVRCHEAKNIYKRPEEVWTPILDDMAMRAHITDAQKDAIYKYVLAIKATQPK